jgi:hypothetical protein
VTTRRINFFENLGVCKPLILSDLWGTWDNRGFVFRGNSVCVVESYPDSGQARQRSLSKPWKARMGRQRAWGSTYGVISSIISFPDQGRREESDFQSNPEKKQTSDFQIGTTALVQ